MVDFLRANTWCSREEYLWRMTVPQVRLASVDFSHVEYLTDKEKKRARGRGKSLGHPGLNNDLGIPVLGGAGKK